jgi:hypothetical protein
MKTNFEAEFCERNLVLFTVIFCTANIQLSFISLILGYFVIRTFVLLSFASGTNTVAYPSGFTLTCKYSGLTF